MFGINDELIFISLWLNSFKVIIIFMESYSFYLFCYTDTKFELTCGVSFLANIAKQNRGINTLDFLNNFLFF